MEKRGGEEWVSGQWKDGSDFSWKKLFDCYLVIQVIQELPNPNSESLAGWEKQGACSLTQQVEAALTAQHGKSFHNRCCESVSFSPNLFSQRICTII